MELLDVNEYVRRAKRVTDLANQHPEHLAALPADERSALETYYLGAVTAKDAVVYRRDQLKADPRLETSANKAYEHYLSRAGVPQVLTDAD